MAVIQDGLIKSLRKNEIFVFGSNLEGHHMGGAAKQAAEQFGATWGVGVGFSGQTYAIPTMGGFDQIQDYVKQFLWNAQMFPEFTFLLTKIGCGIAGYEESESSVIQRYSR